MFNLVCVSLSLLLLVLNIHCSSVTVKQTANGPVEGVEQTSSLGQKYYAFLGIPYAEPPITGRDPYTNEEVDRRFKAPIPLKRMWNETLNVHSFGNFCIPSTFPVIPGQRLSEDCLFLNIYVPVGGAEKKTVLVWIHGGAFSIGNAGYSIYGPDFLLFEDNIVVTVQYRLGIFGFLNLGTDEYSGNMGLKDQQLAIKWVYENIEHFSGKQNEILLFGESAGSASVSFHMLNEESRKYFNRAYASSSSAFSYYALMEADHVERMQKFSKIYDMEGLIEYLKTAEDDVLSNCHPYVMNDETFTAPWVPTIENPRIVGAFLTKTPEQLYSPDNEPVMDAMFSFNSRESVPFRPNMLEHTEPIITNDWKDPNLRLTFDGLNETTYPEEYKHVLEKLSQAYLPDTTDIDAIICGNIDLISDMNFGDSVLKTAILQSIANNRGLNKSQHKNTFLFRFSVDVGLNLFKLKDRLTYDGAGHGEDLCYIFHCHMFDQFNLYDKHLEMKDITYDAIIRMTKIITNFARTGNPSVEGDTPFESCKSPTEVYCQEISNNAISSVTNDIKEQLHYDMWREIEETYKNLAKDFQETTSAF